METQTIDISPDKNGALLKELLVKGNGSGQNPLLGSKVTAHYTGTLTDGTVFDSSRDRNKPLSFVLGKGTVIKAWDLGVATMEIGERAIFTCAPEYCYGTKGFPPTIPPNATLKFDIELINWRGEDLSRQKNYGIERFVLSLGEGCQTPNDGGMVDITITGKFNDREFENRTLSFVLGEGSANNIVEGIEITVQKMKKGEQCRVLLQPEYAFGQNGNKDFDIPSNATVEYVIKLNNFEREKESWAMDANERIKQATMYKEKGTKYFKEEKYSLAITMYKKIESILDFDKNNEDAEKEERTGLLLASYLNISLAELKMKNYFAASSAATSALEIDSQNVKALFRRGQALLGIHEPEKALKDFKECLKIEPNNKAAQTNIHSCNKFIKDIKQKEMTTYANMFDKFAKTDIEREEIEKKKLPNVLSSVGEWGQEDREREPSEFEKENPNILMLSSSGEFKDM